MRTALTYFKSSNFWPRTSNLESIHPLYLCWLALVLLPHDHHKCSILHPLLLFLPPTNLQYEIQKQEQVAGLQRLRLCRLLAVYYRAAAIRYGPELGRSFVCVEIRTCDWNHPRWRPLSRCFRTMGDLHAIEGATGAYASLQEPCLGSKLPTIGSRRQVRPSPNHLLVDETDQ